MRSCSLDCGPTRTENIVYHMVAADGVAIGVDSEAAGCSVRKVDLGFWRRFLEQEVLVRRSDRRRLS